MSIKYKIILVLLVAIVLSSGIQFWIEQYTIMPSFVALQNAEAMKDIDRCIRAVKSQVDPLSTMGKDWSAWDDTYAFVKDRNAAYLESTLPPESFVSGKFNLLYIFDRNDQLVWGQTRDSHTGEPISIQEFNDPVFLEQSGLLRHHSVDSSMDGILLTGMGPLLTSSKPITTSENTGPIRGTFIMGRLLDQAAIDHLSEDLSVPFTVEALGTDLVSMEKEYALQKLTETGSPVIEDGDHDRLQASGIIHDIQGEPALLVKAYVPQSIIAKGRAAILFASWSILFVSAVTLIVTYFILDKTVLSRIFRISRKMDDITRSEDLSIRAEVASSDELGRLEVDLNKMLEHLAGTKQKIIRAKQEWESTFDAVPDLIAILDNHHRILRVNKPMAKRLGLTPEAVVGKLCYECIHGTDSPPDFCPHAKYLSEGGEHTEEIYDERLGGHFCVSVSPLLDPGGEYFGVVHVARDINQRKQAEERLRESTQRLALHVEQTPLAVIEWDLDFRVIEWNQGAESTFGYSRDEAIGRHGSFILSDKTKTHCTDIWHALLEKRGGNRSCNENVTCDGRAICCEWYNTPLIGPDGTVMSVTSLAMDVTERKQADDALRRSRAELADSIRQLECANLDLQQQTALAHDLAVRAEHASAVKSQFLANMSHEIRTPMNSIICFSDMLTQEDLTVEQKEQVDMIRHSGRNLLNLINDILDSSKIEASQLDVDMIDCSLGQLLNSLEPTITALIQGKSVDFEIVAGEDLPAQIHSDPFRLNQCLTNLLSNAVKFTDLGHVHLKVSLHEKNSQHFIQFDIEDTGIGIPRNRQQAIFESFSQADGSTTRKYGGTGLGLTITKQLVALLGGALALTSEPGRGSVFSLSIPTGRDITGQPLLDRNKVYDQDTEELSLANMAQFFGKVLVAEDVAANQKLMQIMLSKMDVDVVLAGDGNQAVHEALSQSFDLILMDMQMPNMNGYEAARALRQQGYKTPIVALTANAMKGDDQMCFEAGCDGYLAKPIDHRELSRVLAKYLPARKNVSTHTVGLEIVQA